MPASEEPAQVSRLSQLFTKASLTGTTALLVYLGLADFVAHMAFAGNYGYFRDELYYVVAGTQHLSLGYVDFPPLVAYVAAFLNIFTGDSLVSLQVVPAIVEGLLVVTTGMIARELGGGRRAQVLAAICTLCALVYLADGSEFGPDAFDQLWWALLAYMVIRTIKRKEPKLWIASGVVVGIGLITKLPIFFFVVALLVSFLAIPSSRTYLRSKWVPIAALISIAFVLPMIYWNAVNGWPMVEFYREFTGDFGGGGLVNFTVSQISQLSFFDFPIVLLGLYFYLRSTAGREFRVVGLAFIIVYVFMTAVDFKPYYLAPVYPMMLAAGAVLIEQSSTSRKGVARWFGSRPYLAGLALVAILLAPLVIPILPPATLISTYGPSTVSSANAGVASGETGPLPQELGDRLGWNAMVATVAQDYDSLPADQKSQACIFASNYGEASALNFLGEGLGLPPTISGHNSYFIWGPGSCTGQVLITVGVAQSTAQQSYANVTLLTTITCQYCMSLENNVTVLLCTKPDFTSIASVWPGVRQYD